MNGDGNKAAITQATFRSTSSRQASQPPLPPPPQQLIRGSGGMFPFFTMYASKADQILSRYRPIAPKPPAPKADGTATTTTTDSTTAAAQSSSSVTSRKGRKRSGEALASPRAYKRGASNSSSRKQQQQQQQAAAAAAASAGVVPVVVEIAGGNVVVTGGGAMVPAMAAAMEAGSGRSTLTASVSVSPSGGRSSSEATPLPGGEGLWKVMRPDAAAVAVAGGGGGISSSSSWCERFRGGGQQQQLKHHPLEDAGSTGVVVNAPASVGGFVRGGDGVNLGCDWKSGYEMLMDQRQQLLLLQQHRSNNSRSMSDLGSVNSAFVYSNVQLPSSAATVAAQVVYDSNNEACSNAARDVDNSLSNDKPKLVTLSLLPDTPSHPHHHSTSTCAAVGGGRFRLRFSDGDDDLLEQQQPPLKLSLFSGGGGQDVQEIRASALQQQHSVEASIDHHQQQFRGSNAAAAAEQRVPEVKQGIVGSLISRAAAAPLIDVAYLEQAYGGSSDPVMLTDEGNRLLWANLAYTKVRMSGAGKPQRAAAAVAGPYIDPLGLPTQLGCFTFRRATECSAVLWGFLKKFMFRENAAGAAVVAMTNGGGGGGEVVEQNVVHQNQRVITPLPIRLVVASTVCLDCITDANCYSGYLVGSLETVEAQLEKAPLPALVTDRSNRVRWVNAAYHQLVGRAAASSASSASASASSSRMLEVQDSNSTTASSAAAVAAAAAAAEVCFMFQTEKSPYSAVSLAGEVRVDWMDGGKRCCLASIPCEMRRLDDEHFGSLFVWKLNLNLVEAR